MVNRRRLRMEQVLDVLPDVDDLAPLREALIDASRVDAGEAWAGSRAYATVGRRLADPARVESMIPEITERLRVRAEKVLQHSVHALRALERGDIAAAAHALIAAGEVEEGAWRLEEAERYYRKGLELGRKPRDRRGEALALKRLARLARTRGELAEALRLYRSGYEVSEAARDVPGMVVGCLGLGNVHVDRGEWAEARRWYLRGIDRVGRSTPEFLHLCNGLSIVERRLGRFEESEAWLLRGEEEAPRVDDAAARRYLEHGRARLHLARGEMEEAERVFRQMVEAESEPVARISGLINLAEPLLLRGRLLDAERVLRDAETLALQYRAVSHLAYVYEQMGRVAAARRDPEGFLFFEQALELTRQHRLPAAQQAGVQHGYGLFEAEVGSLESAAARLRIAGDLFGEIGAELEAAAVKADLAALHARMARADEPASPSETLKEQSE